MQIKPVEEEVVATELQESQEAAPAKGKRGAKQAASQTEETLSIRRKIDKQSQAGRKQKVYTLTQPNGIWFKLNQHNVTVYDPEKDRVRAIRYCPNEPSIYLDEQNKDSIREHIIFRDGLIYVGANKANLQDYLDTHPDNTKNGGYVFGEVNTEQKAVDLLNNEFLLHDAVGLVRDKDITDLLPVAIFLNINIEQKNSEIKRELLMEAKANPERFIKLFDNPTVRARAVVVQAAEYGIIRVSNDSVSWAETGRPIVSVAAGQDPNDVMTRFLLQDRGAPVYEEITTRLSKLA